MFRPVIRTAALALLLALLATLAACRQVSPQQMASMPRVNYHIEYYMITPK